MACFRALLAWLALLVSLAGLHVLLLALWYSTGFRQVFTRGENVHLQDILLAVNVAEAGSEAHALEAAPGPARPSPQKAEGSSVALLFMLRKELIEIELWRRWLQPEADRAAQGLASRVSVFFHLADGAAAAGAGTVAALSSLPGVKRIIPTVRTGWCELMAAEVALFREALVDDSQAEMFVLLPHDAVPLWPLSDTLNALLSGPDGQGSPRSRVCPAGVRDLDVPHDCAHGLEPHWARALLFKHHQWLALNRRHAQRLVDPKALQAASAVFNAWFLGEPLCSDEVLPLLTLSLTEEQVSVDRNHVHLSQLGLYQQATFGLHSFEAGLADLGASSECIMYAPWPGCHAGLTPGLKRAKSPVMGGGLLPSERDELLAELARAGVLFGRKLGKSGGDVSTHMAMLDSISKTNGSLSLRAPRRLLPLPPQALDWSTSAFFFVMQQIPIQLRWGFASIRACLPIWGEAVLAGGVAYAAGQLAVTAGALGRRNFHILLSIFVVVHLVIFVISITAFSEYSPLEPLRKLGVLGREEL